MVGYCDSDFSGDLDKRRSLSGYIFTIGGNTISWKSSLQHVVALSSTEAEYISLIEVVKEALWLRGILSELSFVQRLIAVYCDSQSAIHLTKNAMIHERTKHIDIKLHFIRDIVTRGLVEIAKIVTEINPVDLLTKVIHVSKFNATLDLLKLLPR